MLSFCELNEKKSFKELMIRFSHLTLYVYLVKFVCSIIVWEESDYQQFPSLSESEHTAESTWNGSTDTSDRGSIFNFQGCPSLEHKSPTQERSKSFATGPSSDQSFASENSIN